MDMGNISLNDGTVVLIRSEKDLLEVIRKYLSNDIGDELEKYLDDIANEIVSLNDELFQERYIN